MGRKDSPGVLVRQMAEGLGRFSFYCRGAGMVSSVLGSDVCMDFCGTWWGFTTSPPDYPGYPTLDHGGVQEGPQHLQWPKARRSPGRSIQEKNLLWILEGGNVGTTLLPPRPGGLVLLSRINSALGYSNGGHGSHTIASSELMGALLAVHLFRGKTAIGPAGARHPGMFGCHRQSK